MRLGGLPFLLATGARLPRRGDAAKAAVQIAASQALVEAGCLEPGQADRHGTAVNFALRGARLASPHERLVHGQEAVGGRGQLPARCLTAAAREAPFDAFGATANLTNILIRRARGAGIRAPRDHRAPRPLRHAPAKRLPGQEVPTGDISRILGHVDRRTTGTCLRMDVDSLSACALGPAVIA